MSTPTTSSPARGGLAGLVAATTALGAGELVAGLVASWASPVEAVADVVIDRSPTSVTRFGIETFGDNDKPALVIGILVLLALAAVVVGVLGRRRPAVAVVAFAGVGAVGAWAATRSPVADLGAVLPSIVAAVVGAGAYLALRAAAVRPLPAPTTPATGTPRRAFLALSAGVVTLAALAGAGGRALRGRFSAAQSRQDLVLPPAPSPLAPLPAAVEVAVDGMPPFVTPNADFYRVDTALQVPQVPVEGWTLRIHGMVERPLTVTFDELVARGLVEADITLTCVSNPVGGRLVGHARWLGVPLRVLLDEVGVDPAADQVVGRSVDGYTGGFPLAAAYDRQALVAVGMNGEALPLEHGFPARLITPGLYGYVSATKWLTEIELTTFADFDQYWVPRGYAAEAPIKAMARIDVPRSGNAIDAGPTTIAGVAWAQTRGISAVEVSIDDAPFVAATLADEVNADSWRQWRLDWDATAGAHRIIVRAVDGDGQVQIEERAEIYPDGASGWMSQLVTVRAGAA